MIMRWTAAIVQNYLFKQLFFFLPNYTRHFIKKVFDNTISCRLDNAFLRFYDMQSLYEKDFLLVLVF